MNFTGQNQDTVPSQNGGLYDFLFREYNPQHGRWISPDPAGMSAVSMGSPQTWNRYGYVANIPLESVDPAGLFHMMKNGAEQDATDYLRAMARTDGFFDRFEFFSLYQSQWNGERWEWVKWLGLVGPGDDQFEAGTPAPHTRPQTPQCTAAQQAAANLANLFDTASTQSGWIAFGTGALTALAGVGEEPTLALDTPATITAASVTSFFATTSTITGTYAAGLNSFANGNMTALENFSFGQLANLAATAAASKLPLVKPWAERIGDLAEKGVDLAVNAKEACK